MLPPKFHFQRPVAVFLFIVLGLMIGPSEVRGQESQGTGNTIEEADTPSSVSELMAFASSASGLSATPDTLLAAFTGGIFIGSLVFQSGASLTNLLSVPVTITYVRQRNHLGNVNAESAFDKVVLPGQSNGFTVSYNFIQPTQEQFSEFELEFTVSTPTGQIVHTYKNNALQSLGLSDISMDAGRPDTLSLQSTFRNGTAPFSYSIQKSRPGAVGHVFDGDGVIFTPSTSGSTGITISATDAAGDSETAHFILTAESVPTATDDEVQVNEDESVEILVLQNDVDPDGLELSVAAVLTPPVHGAAQFTSTTLTYTPEANYHGRDSLQYQVTNGARSASAWLRIEITSVNDIPVITTTTLPDAQEAEPYSFQVVATDIDGDTITFQSAGLPAGLTLDNAGLIAGMPSSVTAGEHAVDVTASDSESSASASFMMTVQPPRPVPTAVADTVTTNEDVPVTFNVLTNDHNPNGDILTAVITQEPLNGTLLELGSGLMQFTPAADFNGSDGLRYSLQDTRGNADTTDVILVVLPVNDPPTAADDTGLVVSGDTTTIDVLANDTDPENDPLTITISRGPSEGQAWVDAENRVVYTAPNPFEGAVELTYTASDPDGLTDTATVTITVIQANRPPTASEMYIPQPGQPLVLSGSETSRVVFAWTESVDPDGDDVSYRWRLFESLTVSLALRTRHEPFAFFETDMAFMLAIVDSLNGGSGADVTLFQSVDALAGLDTTSSGRTPLLVQRGVFIGIDPDVLPDELTIGTPYPNPTGGQAYLDVRAPGSTVIQMSVFDILGREVSGAGGEHAITAGSNRLPISVGRLPRGLYVLEMALGDRQREVRYLVRL
ncbi:MAG: Ig-like domain-containing protein [Rhodothermales bacterium]